MKFDESVAEQWFIKSRWPNGVTCPHCNSIRISDKTAHPTMPFRCRDCRRFFSAKTGSVMKASRLSYSVWLTAIYFMTTSPKGISALQLSKHLAVDYKTAWYLAHRIREGYDTGEPPFSGTVEIDETWVGGKVRNLSLEKRRQFRMDGVPYEMTCVIGAKERESNKIWAEIIPENDVVNLKGFTHKTVADGATVYTDQHPGYRGMRDIEH